MNLFEQWKKDMNLLYFEYNLYIEPKFKILKVEKFTNHKVNSSCFWCNEKNGIMYNWINIDIYSKAVNYKNNPIRHSDKIILEAFKFHKDEWIKNIRKEKKKHRKKKTKWENSKIKHKKV